MAPSSKTVSSKREEAVVKQRAGTPEPERPVQPDVLEIGGPKGPEPTRYGDWEKGGRCTDF